MTEAIDSLQEPSQRPKKGTTLLSRLAANEQAWVHLESTISSAAWAGGGAVMRYYRHARPFSEGYDAATEADHASTRAIIRALEPDLNRLSREFSFGYSYFGEEFQKISNSDTEEQRSLNQLLSEIGEARGNVRLKYSQFTDYFDHSSLSVLFDPLDGTNAFRSEIPVFRVGIAFFFDNRPIIGAICDPIHNVVYYGSIREGDESAKAWYVSTGDIADLKTARQRTLTGRGNLVHIACQNTGQKKERPNAIRVYEKLTENFRDITIPNAGVFAMEGVARGSFDAYVNTYTLAWDIAAGETLVKAIGGEVTGLDREGIDYTKDRVSVIAAAPEMHEQIYNICTSS